MELHLREPVRGRPSVNIYDVSNTKWNEKDGMFVSPLFDGEQGSQVLKTGKREISISTRYS